ncbi:MAG: methylenetetrahydrofolate reductase, partial [Chloroflexota bacterium]|nr:methylenetetrahydrofolate reductase [Chloroflexota bacterium]
MARIIDLLAAGRTFSFEFFPPKDEDEQRLLTRTIADLQPLKPSFVSVTYRGGRISRERTTRVVIDLLRTTELTPMPHLTCVAHPRFELGEIIGGFRAAGLENLLALGGDPLPSEESYKELEYASQLVELGRRLGFESIGVAAHPAGHPRSPDLRSDRRHLADKLALADFAITQFFFKVEEYERLRDELAALGNTKPIIAGIMPITSLVSVQRMAQLSGYAVPDDIVRRIEAGGDDRDEIRKRGIEV